MPDKKPNQEYNGERKDGKRSEFERFEDLARKVLQVPREEVDKLREQEKRDREKRRAG